MYMAVRTLNIEATVGSTDDAGNHSNEWPWVKKEGEQISRGSTGLRTNM